MISNTDGDLTSPFIGVLYTSDDTVSIKVTSLPHGNSIVNADRPYIRTSKDTLDKVREKIKQGREGT